MKKWFIAFDDNQKIIIIISFWIATVLFLFLSAIASFFSLFFVAGLAASILCSVWATDKKTKSRQAYSFVDDEEIKRKREAFLQQKLKTEQDELASLPRCPINLSTEKRKRKTGYVEPAFSGITTKGKYNGFVVFDTETTGLTPSKDRIIELAAIRFVNGVPTEIFETFVNPERPIPPTVTSINHITDGMVADAPTISQILPAFEAFVGNSPLVAHNLEFDLKFIFYSGSSIMDSPRKYFDTLKIAQKMLDKPSYKYDRELEEWVKDFDRGYDVHDYKLETLAEYYNITFPDKHRAAADAMVTGKLFLKFINNKQTS